MVVVVIGRYLRMWSNVPINWVSFMGLVPSPSESGIFSLRPSSGSSTNKTTTMEKTTKKKTTTSSFSTEPNTHADEVLVLFTSGTTGNKKLVPHNMGDILTAAATIALSWDLSPSDVNCNLMPLFHVGGIVRQVFSPIFSGGCVICCPSFDPSIFWSLLSKRAFTWYYAAPTMHQLILQTGQVLPIRHVRLRVYIPRLYNSKTLRHDYTT